LKAGVNEVNQYAVTACDEAIDWLTKACDASMPKSGKNSRRPVPLRTELLTDVEIIAFADDVVLLTTASVPFLVEERLEEGLQTVIDWMTDNGLELATEKTEAIMLTY